jgi:hypothetical protein
MSGKDDQDIQEIFKGTGRRHGYDFVEANFFPFKELKSTWHRNRWKVAFRISDYMSGCGEDVLTDYSDALFRRMVNGERVAYTDSVMCWLKSDEFIEMNRPLYLERSRNLSLSPEGRYHDLQFAMNGLRDKGLIEDMEDVHLTWTRSANRKRVGYCSVLMKVIAISSALDSLDLPSFVPEYVLYHELVHLEMGRETLSPRHGREFRRKERLFPRWEEAESWLRRVASHNI